ncbi:hypothetical protein J6A31_08880 [bacterium]|nr:hypothetical protein [bacterium]
MTSNEYAVVCDKIISSTTNLIDTSDIKRFNIDRTAINASDPISLSAITSSAPMTLVYTPAGSGKSKLIYDRINALKTINVPIGKMMVLSMNIAKAKQIEIELPGIKSMTFSDFTHNIFSENYPDCETIDIESLKNLLKLTATSQFARQFSDILSTADPQEKMVKLTLFVNAHLDETINLLSTINKSDYSIESIICQNKIYTFAKNPYDIDALLINGVHNMPVPILCAILAYANRYKCNLFITGSPKETIYDFNMAYANAMNVLSSFASTKNIDIIRLMSTQRMDDDIKHVLEMTPIVKLKNVSMTTVTANHDVPLFTIINDAIKSNNDFIINSLKNKKQILMIARSKADIAALRQVIENELKSVFPNMKITDLTLIQAPITHYGEVAVQLLPRLQQTHPTGITTQEFFFNLYNEIYVLSQTTTVPYLKEQYHNDTQTLLSFSKKYSNVFGEPDSIHSIEELVHMIIDCEAATMKEHNEFVKSNVTFDLSESDIVLSTIHASTDLHMDNVLIIFKNFTEHVDEKLYRVALSRANKTEHIVFINYGRFETPHQRYIKTHME